MLTLFRNLFSPPRHIILLALAAWLGISLAEKRARRHNVGLEDLNNLVFYGIVALVLGGRLAFILENLSAFLKSPWGIFSINPDLFDPVGGLAAALLAGLIYGQRKGLRGWATLDALTPFFAVLAVGLGLSHLAAGTFFGKETDLPFGMELWNATRHPTQLYETLAALLILILVWRAQENLPSGVLFLRFAAQTAFAHVLIQSFRADVAPLFSRFNPAQILAWLALALCFFLLESRLPKEAARG